MLDALSVCAIPLATMQLCLTSPDALRTRCSLECPSAPFHAQAVLPIPLWEPPTGSAPDPAGSPAWSLRVEVQLFLGQNVWVLPSACRQNPPRPAQQSRQPQEAPGPEDASSSAQPQHVQQLLDSVRKGLQPFSRAGEDGGEGELWGGSHGGAVWVSWRQLPGVWEAVVGALLALQQGPS